ncbi:MAG: sigma-70 family RNA polymerase sigma factor [Bacillota bacterium]
MNKFKKINIGEWELLSDSETKELLAQTKRGKEQAKDKLIKHNLRLVLKIAHKFNNQWNQLEEVFQVGTLGLIKAIDQFDLQRDVKFSTYAVPLIIGEIKTYLRDNEQIKVARSLKQRAKQIRKMQSKLQNDLKREATIKELSIALGLSSVQIVKALEAVKQPTSIHEQYQQGENSLELEQQLAGAKDEYEVEINRLTLAGVLKNLSERAKKIIKLRYFADKSQTEIAEIIGVSQAQVSRLEKKILNDIRSQLED